MPDSKQPIVLVSGSRFFQESQALWNVLSFLCPITIYVGDAPGADKAARHWCSEFGNLIPNVFRADWVKYSRGAGPRRNEEMVLAWMNNRSAPHVAVFCWVAGEDQSGTRDCYARVSRVEADIVDVGPRPRDLSLEPMLWA